MSMKEEKTVISEHVSGQESGVRRQECGLGFEGLRELRGWPEPGNETHEHDSNCTF